MATASIAGVEHAWDDGGFCQLHGTHCSFAPTEPPETDVERTREFTPAEELELDRWVEPPTAETVTLAAQQAAGLRRVADLIEANPGLAKWLRTSLAGGINAHPPIHDADDDRAALAWFVRITKAAGAVITKNASEKLYNVTADFGAVALDALSWRHRVCKRVVTGTTEVTEMVPDPDAPLVEVTKTVEQVEWRCPPLLAEVTT